MRFTKMHGTANDYVVVDCLAASTPADLEPLIRAVCDRRRGVGADGFVLILPDETADAEMRMYNPDGSFAAMCGNAVRCVAKHLRDTRRVDSREFVIRSANRRVPIRVLQESAEQSRIEANLGSPRFAPNEIPTTLPAGADGLVRQVSLALPPGTASIEAVKVTCLSMGNPHCVVFTDTLPDRSVDHAEVLRIGPAIETASVFPERTNVEFIEVVARGHLRQRTWERGAGETLACGSGACAAAVAAVMTDRADRLVTIELRGGTLEVHYREDEGQVLMTGDAVTVFEGSWPE
ncbi:diaminopimelate epimerase [Botrimarina hoheduenensis]|uniref:Diaminopimelate epimerase n=1 Tax=Botrimarina hoheduenensis TaxID=2528000 RepID=A0A5C5VVP8_9BACT|nr:diaminopimelate epimerase [Botrimarina hoheduenensis]TWT41592.1 Diaminopimelate epimerase [Botrimarina hoheduenensis]